MQTQRIEAIVIGGSAGALDVLLATMPALPARFPIPIAVVLHLLPGKPSLLAELLRDRCQLSVKEAEDKEELAPGTMYVAPPNYHLLLERRRCFSLSVDEPVHFSRPAIDVLFESAADAYGPALAGVLLTGANDDGARGLHRINKAGGMSMVQEPDSAFARPMPAAALQLFQPDRRFDPKELPALLRRLAPSSLENAEAP